MEQVICKLGILPRLEPLMVFYGSKLSFINTIVATFVLYAVFLDDVEVTKAKKTYKNPLIDMVTYYSVAIRDIPFVLTVIGYGLLIVSEDVLPGFVGIRLQRALLWLEYLGLILYHK